MPYHDPCLSDLARFLNKTFVILPELGLAIGSSVRLPDTVKVLGRTRICGCRSDKTGRHMFILVDTFAALEPVYLPPEVGIVGEAGPWAVHALSSLLSANPVPEGDAIESKLLALLQQEGKSMGDVKAVFMGTQPPTPDVSTDVVNAIGKLVEGCNQAPSDDRFLSTLRIHPV